MGKSAYRARLTTRVGIPGTHSGNPDRIARACNLSTLWGMAGGKRRLLDAQVPAGLYGVLMKPESPCLEQGGR